MNTEERKRKLRELEQKVKKLSVEAALQKSSPGQPIQNGFENFVKQIFRRYE